MWARQSKGWGMGNFINCTPAIQKLAEQEKVKVVFEEPYLKDMFRKAEFMEIVDKPESINPDVDSMWTNQSIPDWRYIYQRVIGNKEPEYKTYVDKLNPVRDDFKYYVVLRGGILGREDEKDPGEEIYREIKKEISRVRPELQTVYLGISEDFARYGSWIEDFQWIIMDDVKDSLRWLNGAEFIISNDTGMYHAAGALNKKGFIIWKDTNAIKNRSPNQGFTYSIWIVTGKLCTVEPP